MRRYVEDTGGLNPSLALSSYEQMLLALIDCVPTIRLRSFHGIRKRDGYVDGGLTVAGTGCAFSRYAERLCARRSRINDPNDRRRSQLQRMMHEADEIGTHNIGLARRIWKEITEPRGTAAAETPIEEH